MREEGKKPPNQSFLDFNATFWLIAFLLVSIYGHLFYFSFYNRKIIKVIPFLVFSVSVHKFFYFVIIDS